MSITRLNAALEGRYHIESELGEGPRGTPEVPTAFRVFAPGVLGRPGTFWIRAEPEGKVKDPLYMFLYMFGSIISVKSSSHLPQISELFPRSSPNQ